MRNALVLKLSLQRTFRLASRMSTKTIEFIKMNPLVKVLVLETPDGVYLIAMPLHAMLPSWRRTIHFIAFYWLNMPHWTKPKVEADEEEEAPKPKTKNHLDLLPPNKMILDEWKRVYSNTNSNFRVAAIKGFWFWG